ncbi:SRPBCC family protein [Actinomadura madurae]|uniref:SRPBCC family protein n=1 Tax=Actinomadura madurae TaxID=1993 RepID=UPI002027520E|nr:SRPBCC family protein [Actinomadura madurae]MCP9948624.1 SRPBCC family protein [Actinomadura madurae]MCP9965398.1 SRPBCC family protein [Actinomadura madurae]MCQ0010613.1 SRPBCC family protein [Actinomadura madurae]MCQ0014072.1 SRPBCC family protein [Actinomadura madurae]URM94269.1 SRPBCC family protein [Actinomadura madurae]
MIQATATTTAAPEDLFRHLAVPEAWGAWGRFPTPARQARKGDTTTYGVGTVKKIWPASEQTVAYEPYTHFGYIALRGLPVRRYRSDVHLEDGGHPENGGQGTLIRWEATFEPLIPGTGALVGFGLRLMLKTFVTWLPAHVEHCPADCPARRAGDI